MFLLCCYDVMFTLETLNIQHEVFFGLRDLSVMSLCSCYYVPAMLL